MRGRSRRNGKSRRYVVGRAVGRAVVVGGRRRVARSLEVKPYASVFARAVRSADADESRRSSRAQPAGVVVRGRPSGLGVAHPVDLVSGLRHAVCRRRAVRRAVIFSMASVGRGARVGGIPGKRGLFSFVRC